MNATQTIYKCISCDCVIQRKKQVGRIPLRCESCNIEHKRRIWRQRNPVKERKCIICAAKIEEKPNVAGQPRKRCEKCHTRFRRVYLRNAQRKSRAKREMNKLLSGAA